MALFSIAILPLLIAGGYFVINAKRIPAFLLPPLITVLALSVAMLWILKLGLRDSWGANVKRDSGLFSFSMSFSTFYILLLQIFIFAIVFAIAMAFFFKNVDFGAIFENLIINPEMQIEDFAIDSDLVLLVLFMVAFSVPLIEELFKTIGGVWFLKPRKISPREGWIAGLMSGAGFGLIEAYLYSMQGVMMTTFPDWLYFILGRTGGLLLHTFAGGIVGWGGLAKSWREKRPTYAVGGAYIVALLTHSLWNSIAVGQAVLLNQFDIEVPDVAVYISLSVLFVAMLVAYLMMSQNIAREPRESITKDNQARPYLPQDLRGGHPTGVYKLMTISRDDLLNIIQKLIDKFCNQKIYNAEIPESLNGALLVTNHISRLDVVFLMLSTKRKDVIALTASNYRRALFFGTILKKIRGYMA